MLGGVEDGCMLRARERNREDLSTVTGWIPDADTLNLFTGPRLQWPLTAEQLIDMELLDGFSAWIAVDEELTAVGHFDLTLDHRTARLGRVIIDPEKRGRGLAHALIHLAIARARELDADEIQLNVIAGNGPASRTYERAGFTRHPTPLRPGVERMFLAL